MPRLAGQEPGVCRYGYCTEFRCPDCSGYLGGWGPVGCRCDGYIRWMWHPDMAPALDHAPVKPSRRPTRLSRRGTRRR
jgi:hypothetical protein